MMGFDEFTDWMAQQPYTVILVVFVVGVAVTVAGSLGLYWWYLRQKLRLFERFQELDD